MKKRMTLRKLLVTSAALAVVGLVGSPAEAGCSSFDRSFGTYPSSNATGCGPFYCYVTSPGDNTLQSMEGFYWVLGSGASRNSGAYTFDGQNGSQPWGVVFTSGWSLSSTVNNGLTTGCPDSLPVVFLFSDTDTANGRSLYGLAAVDETLAGLQAYDIGLAGNLTLQPIPNCTITDTSRDPDDDTILSVGLSWTPNGNNAFTTSSSTITNVNQVITGWNFYSREVGRGDAAPTDLNVRSCGVSGDVCTSDVFCDSQNTGDTCQDIWTLRGTVPGESSTSGQVTFSCDDPDNNEVFLAMAPELDNGFTAPAYVGGASTRIECGATLADPADRKNFKLIEKPSKLKRR